MLGIIIPTEQESKYIIRKNGIVYIVSGAGKVNATIAAMELILMHKCHAILCVGSCGALNDAPIGSIIYPKQYIQADMDLSALDYDYGLNLGEDKDYIEPLCINDIKNPMLSCAFAHTKIATSDKVIKDKKDSTFIKNYFDTFYVDMESYAIAKVCIKYNISFSTIRAVTDNQYNQGDWVTNLELAMTKLNNILTEIL